jgi:2-polyprenyl-3-methyl-5-hydroxy-6-metoxy-1,4-benzoquinol methylase
MSNTISKVTHEQEIQSGKRFAFGENWKRFLEVLDETKIEEAVASLKTMLEVETLNGKKFLDVGCGSGLFSLAAKRLGAEVFSFDYDPQSVACTKELKKRYYTNERGWQVETGSVLDKSYLGRLGEFDIVYSWGVLHHTGDMWTALENVGNNVAQGGKLFISLYNYQQFASRYWHAVKKTYNRYVFTRPFLLFIHFVYPGLPSAFLRMVQGRKKERGMSPWHDLKDWVGGYPFEVSKPEEILDFYRKRGYQLFILKTANGRNGCNQFVFLRSS